MVDAFIISSVASLQVAARGMSGWYMTEGPRMIPGNILTQVTGGDDESSYDRFASTIMFGEASAILMKLP